jgi:hypothetical protein
MSKKLVVVALVVVVAATGTSFAKDMTGRLSLGFHNSDAPIGARYWATDKVAIDVGIGFVSNEILDPQSELHNKTVNTFSFWFEGGVPVKLYDADNAHFFVRPSIVMGLLDDRDYGTKTADAKWTSLDFVLSLGGELFFGDHFSVEATHGVKMTTLSAPNAVKDEVGAGSFTSFSTFGENLTTVGFHFYF